MERTKLNPRLAKEESAFIYLMPASRKWELVEKIGTTKPLIKENEG